ncbi:MAG: SdpI family protein [Oscillospiraceae bacterium]|nr:SdpI family protein [Oscillospiraceae bacterium]
MKSKAMKAVYIILILLPFAVTATALQILPDDIPAHYGAGGAVDRWGSKYEMLIMPGANLLMGLFMLGMARLAAKKEQSGSNNEKVTLIAGVCVLVLFNAMTYIFLYNAYKNVNTLSDEADFYSLEFGIMGLLFIFLGNYMPKLRMNGAIGFRTSWTMKNEEIWKISQRIAGISMMTAGAVIFILALFTKGWVCMVLSGVIFVAMIIADLIVSYKISLKY